MNGFDLTEHLGTAALVLGAMVAIHAWYRFVLRPKGTKEFLTGHATVVSRRVEQKDPHRSGFSRWKYLVSFDLGAQMLELQVSEGDYGRLTEGLTGELEWQYEYLVSFTPDTDG